MHFYESSVITTKDGLQCQVYGNEHPFGRIIVKPKYIPTNEIECSALQYRFISGRKMNRLNFWADKEKLKAYLDEFRKCYCNYVYISPVHMGRRIFFSVSVDNIERIYFPRRGLAELMKMPYDGLDKHLKTVHDFFRFLLKSGLRVKDLGITYSTLIGHYFHASDINVVVYGKKNFWKLMHYLEQAEHPNLRWKTRDEWMDFRKKRNRSAIFSEDEFYRLMNRKKSEGFFNGSLFVIFGAEKDEETWFNWGDEIYSSKGMATVEGVVSDDFSSVVRPGCYEIKDSKILSYEPDNGLDLSSSPVQVKKVVFYSRDYCMLARPGEKIRACGLLEEVRPKKGEPYYRLVQGYVDSYISERREKEYVKVV